MCSEVSQPSGSAGSGPFQCLLRFSRVGSARASAVSTQQKPMGPTLQLSVFHLALWLLGLPARDTVSSPQETLCLDSLLLHCSWDTLGFERCVTISASYDGISRHMTNSLLGIH